MVFNFQHDVTFSLFRPLQRSSSFCSDKWTSTCNKPTHEYRSPPQNSLQPPDLTDHLFFLGRLPKTELKPWIDLTGRISLLYNDTWGILHPSGRLEVRFPLNGEGRQKEFPNGSLVHGMYFLIPSLYRQSMLDSLSMGIIIAMTTIRPYIGTSCVLIQKNGRRVFPPSCFRPNISFSLKSQRCSRV